MRTRHLIVCSAVAALLPALPAAAAGPDGTPPASCHGLPATATTPTNSYPAGSVMGTDGDDVIVTTGGTVYAGAGNDTICAVGTDAHVQIDAGAGDDVIDLSGLTYTSATDMSYPANAVATGDGADTVTGSAAGDIVHLTGTGPDTVVSGAGDDIVEVPRAALDDGSSVDLGDGTDELRVVDEPSAGLLTFPFSPVTGPPVTGGAPLSVTGGSGDDVLGLYGAFGYAVDARRERVTTDGLTLHYRDIDSYALRTKKRGGPSSFVGSGRDESLVATLTTTAASMGGGDDRIEVLGSTRPPQVARLRGGPGVNTVAFDSYAARGSVLDLATGRYVDDGRLQATVRRFQHADVAGVSRLVGSDRADVLTWSPCSKIVIVGRAGNDTIRPERRRYPSCDKPAVLRGGPGDDRITGGPGEDRIDGGPGRDRIRTGD